CIVDCFCLCLYASSLSMCFFFFFQAEDGIRDPLVTGVQTCALPISRQLCTERTSASTRLRRAARSASRNELAWSAVKQPSPTASRRGRSSGGSTVHTVTMRERR